MKACPAQTDPLLLCKNKGAGTNGMGTAVQEQ
jgi:hypothetical protein